MTSYDSIFVDNKPKLIIGISGKIGAGKDTAASLIAEIYHAKSLKTERHAFADKVREIVELLTGKKMACDINLPFINEVYNYTQDEKNLFLPEWEMTIGEMLQKVGTDCMRDNLHIDTWVLSCFNRIKHVKDVVVIPDVRFVNEAKAIEEVGGILIRMNGDPAGIRAKSKRDLNHISETSLDTYNFKYYIENEFNDSFSKLKNKLYDILIREL